MNPIFLWYFLSLRGRINRQEFRLGYLGLLATNVVLTSIVDYFVFYERSGFAHVWDRAALGRALLFPLLFSTIILLWPFVAIFVKRLHDINLSGWWWFATLAVPFVAAGLHMAPTTVFIFVLVAVGTLRGSDGPNRFGAPPRPPGWYEREPR